MFPVYSLSFSIIAKADLSTLTKDELKRAKEFLSLNKPSYNQDSYDDGDYLWDDLEWRVKHYLSKVA